MSGHRVGELWGLVYQLGKRMGKSWHLRHKLEKQAEEPGKPKCTYKATGEPDAYPGCGQPAEYCETEPVSTGTYEKEEAGVNNYHVLSNHEQLRDG
jgi:hypothetical protein